MIQANELRIGNYVNQNGDVILVDGIDDMDIFNMSTGEIPLHSVDPIILTEEILLKCIGTIGGYIYKGWDDMHFFRFDEYNSNMFELEIRNDGFYYGDGKIEFLHNLQNCYFFHENKKKELTVNL